MQAVRKQDELVMNEIIKLVDEYKEKKGSAHLTLRWIKMQLARLNW